MKRVPSEQFISFRAPCPQSDLRGSLPVQTEPGNPAFGGGRAGGAPGALPWVSKAQGQLRDVFGTRRKGRIGGNGGFTDQTEAHVGSRFPLGRLLHHTHHTGSFLSAPVRHARIKKMSLQHLENSITRGLLTNKLHFLFLPSITFYTFDT